MTTRARTVLKIDNRLQRHCKVSFTYMQQTLPLICVESSQAMVGQTEGAPALLPQECPFSQTCGGIGSFGSKALPPLGWKLQPQTKNKTIQNLVALNMTQGGKTLFIKAE